MPHLIDHLAELTASRDRDLLDTTVVRAIRDVLRPISVGIYRRVGDPGAEHWISRARIGPDAAAPGADPLWTDLASLPRLDDEVARRDCLLDASVVCARRNDKSLTLYPIITEREVVGVLEIETTEPLNTGDAATVGTVVRIYGNFLDLLDHSERDPLTGLLNRQTFNAAPTNRQAPTQTETLALRPKNRRARNAEAATWLGVIDIDHFKRVNDGYGHPIGDEVLLLVSRLLRSSFRQRDRLYRFGGEEFVVVLECVTSAEAALAFERLRTNVESFAFPQVGQITVSIGFTRTHPEESLTTAFPRADKALYHAKDHGRNRVAHFERLVEAGDLVEAKISGDVELF
jgi:diguanylate cyclase (GGDEF)-like protein